MAVPVKMPRQGQSVESCIISEWFVKKGDKIKKGDLLFSYETDKAAFEEESPAEGTILDIFFKEGDDVPVLTNVCVIGEEGEDISPFIPAGASREPQADGHSEGIEREAGAAGMVSDAGRKSGMDGKAATRETADEGFITIEQQPSPGDVFISPRAKNLAEKTGADIRFAVPTGPGGRIIERDIRKLQEENRLMTHAAKERHIDIEAVEGTGLGGRIATWDRNARAYSSDTREDKYSIEEPGYEDIKLTNIRKVIGRTMHESLSGMAQLTLNTSFDATDILNLRRQLKANGEKMGLSNITLNDIIVYAASRVLISHKDLNAHFLGDAIRRFSSVNMGVAIDTERGLMVPTIFNCSSKSLNDISVETKKLAEECRKGTINPDKLKGGTFTVTNLGALGIESFTPVINPPQTAILGVNTIQTKIRENNGVIEPYSSINLSLTFDHRAVDGAPAARFLKDLKEYLENFTMHLALDRS
ncbi:MAG TPA: 2-oxo acid dehydrogenase subunit E2 [Ruminiclostridium sp.]|nr:2-oxo acid dehydrogenase subunit E2 [Clostridiaceae bacterium]HAA25324.1 2-oxo acid dehydrogenase subunit E2 [Ruminiclostridium sp.]